MPAHDYAIDLTQQLVISTSTSDADVQIPFPAAPNLAAGIKPGDSSYMLVVAGAPVYLNINAVATSANAFFPVGVFGPFVFTYGSTIHALTSFGTGQVSLVHAPRDFK